jgi:hypothetical protein
MEHFEYKVIPAPRRGVRVKGAKGPAGRFAGALESTINTLSAEGWEYVRAESLPADERHGITRRKTETYQNVLIFRRISDPANMEPPITALLEDQSEPDAEENLFDEIDDDFPEEDEIVPEMVENEVSDTAEEKP